jgi:glutamate/tyrosine decarboxylase-like PLP-dependent enzyme
MGKLDFDSREFRLTGQRAVELLDEYYQGLASSSVSRATTSEAVRQSLREPLPEAGKETDLLLETFRDRILPALRHNGHPRFFGYVASPGTPLTCIAEFLASSVNSNVTSWRSAPAAAELEHMTIDWIKEMLGYPESATGLFVSGGSMANFAALAAARSRVAPDVVRKGVGGARLAVYVSTEAHYSVSKAVGMLGLGTDNVRCVPVLDDFSLDTRALRLMLEEDAAAGVTPMCIVGSAGTTATGAVDDLAGIAAIAREYETWFHVDGSYGGFARIVPSVTALFKALEEADSVALDPHKWLYGPIGCGCVLYRDPATARTAFAHQAEYTRPIGLERDEAFVFWDYGPELSRPFRALPVWMQICSAGVRGLADAMQRNIECARYFESLVHAAPDFEMLAPVPLSVFCFRYCPDGYTGDLDALNERTLIALQRAGKSYLSNARLHGRFALRGCVLNHRTTVADMDLLLEHVREAGQRSL